MYSIFNCSSAAAASASRTLANSLGDDNSSASPERLITSTISLVESGFCALKRSASMTCPSVIELVRADRALNGLGDAAGLFVDLVALAAFDEQTNLRFGAGIAQEDAAFAGELALDFVAQFHHFEQLIDRRLRLYFQIALRLRIFFQAGFQ